MIVPSQNVKIVVATKPVDFRKGHDGLAAVVQNRAWPGSPFRYHCCVPRQTWRPDQGAALGWHRAGHDL